jgi:histidinol-phosphate aminotransferase
VTFAFGGQRSIQLSYGCYYASSNLFGVGEQRVEFTKVDFRWLRSFRHPPRIDRSMRLTMPKQTPPKQLSGSGIRAKRRHIRCVELTVSAVPSQPTPPQARLVAGLPSTVPFVGPEAQERARQAKFRARIGANESVFGPSPKAIAAMTAAAAESWMYGDPENYDLKHALARHHSVGAGNICVGEGIDGMFGYAIRMFTDPGDVVATSRGAYPTYNFHVTGYGGRLVFQPYKDDKEDPEGLLALAQANNARMIYFANPDNPMASWHPASTIQQLIAALPANTVLCLDEAYGDFAPPGTLPPLDVHNPQVLRFRTFSKAYGLAGARVGYCLGEASVIKSFDKIRNHFGMSRVSQAGALAALADQPYLSGVVEQVNAAKVRIGEIAAANGLHALPSATNFVAIDCGRDGIFAKRVLDALIARDVFVRMPGVEPLNRCIRVSAGRKADLDVFAAELPGALTAAGM